MNDGVPCREEMRLAFDCCGRVKVDERIGKSERGSWESTNLVNADIDGLITWSVDLTAEEGKSLELSAYHVLDPMTGRVFHAVIEVQLDRRSIETMLKYLKLLQEVPAS